jgi:branched-chain amino acid transport system ATP-binding protein
VEYEGQKIARKSTPEILRRGIAMIPEGKQLFPGMSVLDNIKLGAYTRSDKHAIARDLEAILERHPILREKQWQPAGSLSGGQQQLVAITRGLLSNPKVLMVDEPCQGLAPLVVKEIAAVMRSIHDSGITVLLIEHNVRFVLGLAHRIFVLASGRLTYEGAADDFSEAEYTKRIYLGGESP